VLDYKDITFSFQERRARGRRRRLGLFLLLVLALAAFIGFRCWRARMAVGDVQELLLADRLDAAGRLLRDARSPLFQRGNFRELQALEELMRGRLPAAVAGFAELRRSGASTALRSGLFLAHFFDRGEMDKLKAYSDYLLPRGGDEVFWHHALVASAFLDVEEADKAVASLSPAFRQAHAKALGLLARFNRSLRSGRVDYVFDRNESPLAYFDLKRRVTRPLVPGIGFAAFDAQFRQGARRFRLTLDGGLQRKIDLLFQGHYGTLVLLDLPENAIAAAYSKPRSPSGGDAAFNERFQPASVIKIVTLLAYLRSGGDGIFPLDCRGGIEVDGRSFYDLAPHGRVADPARALALSCNVAFARMGRAAGADAMADLLRRFLFNAPAFRDLGCEFPTGRLAAGALAGPELAELAVGRGLVSLTTLHAALLAAIVANSGQLFPPWLVDDAKNILGLGFHRRLAGSRQVLADDLNFLRVRKAMAAVVEDEKGTAHRVRGRVRLAVKTGTAGSSASGLDAVFVGFVPYDKPRYAFAFRLERGGQAGNEGALFLNGLLQVLYPGGE
jgi:beta-lactamase class D